MATAAIKVEGLGKRYRLTHGKPSEGYRTLRDSLVDAVKSPFRKKSTTEEFWALDDVSFEVQPGEVVGIIGRNGAGKSTLLKILSRITKPTRGHVEINGRVGSLLEVGTGFHPELTGRDNVYLNGSILGMSRSEVKAKFDEIVAFAEVEKFLDTPVKRYSSGMYVRLAFAVAAHLQPEILIVDEVLAVGDAGFQKKCLGKMQLFAASGRTVLFVSHNMNAAMKLCRSGLLLEKGRVSLAGTIQDVVQKYSAVPSIDGEAIESAIKNNSSGSRIGLIRSANISGARTVTRYDFSTSDEVQIHMQLEADTPIAAARIGIGINNPLGERTFACATHLSKYEVGTLHGRSQASVQFRLPSLVPGRYTVDLAVMDDTGSLLHGLFPATAIEVTDIADSFNTVAQMPETFGHVIVSAQWAITHG